MEPVDIGIVVEEGDDVRRVVFGANQPQYHPLPALIFPDGVVVTEWKLSEEDRARVALGENIRVWVSTFNAPIQPMRIEVTSEDRH